MPFVMADDFDMLLFGITEEEMVELALANSSVILLL